MSGKACESTEPWRDAASTVGQSSRVSSRPPSNAVPPGVSWQAFCGLLLVSFSPWGDVSSLASCHHTPVILIGLVPTVLRDVIRWPEGPKSWLALPTALH